MTSLVANSASAEGVLFGISGPQNALYSIDTETGAATLIGGTGIIPPEGISAPPTALASDPLSGSVWAMFNNSNNLHLLNLETGEAEAVLTLNLGQLGLENPTLRNVGLTYDPNAVLFYVFDLTSDRLYSFGQSGVVSLIGPTELAGPTNVSGLAFDSTNNILYGGSGEDDILYSFDTTTGEATVVGPMAGIQGIGFNANTPGLAYDPGTDTLYLTEAFEDTLYTIDTTTGEASIVDGPLGVNNILGLTFAVGVELAEPERPTITSVTHGQMVTTVNFTGLTGEEYVLLKSLDLEFENPSTVAQVTLDSDTGSMMDDAAFEEEAFYRITTVQ